MPPAAPPPLVLGHSRYLLAATRPVVVLIRATGLCRHRRHIHRVRLPHDIHMQGQPFAVGNGGQHVLGQARKLLWRAL